MIPPRRSRAGLLLLGLTPLCTLALLAAGAPWRDLEVGVPPGEPTSWARWLPAITPRSGPLFPLTGSRGGGAGDRGGTVSSPATVPLDPQIGGAGMLRITTLDVVNHLHWTGARPTGPITGARLRSPPVSPAAQWIGTAALLRLMLHRQQVSGAEIKAHLVELGEMALPAIDAATSEKALAADCDEARDLIEQCDATGRLPESSDGRTAMLLRFCREELGREHPYDPEGTFGARLFLFADEVEPMLRDWLRSGDVFVARNAAVALGRYRTKTAQAALLEAVAKTKDPVILMRALSGLEAPCDAAPLLSRLRDNSSAVESAAIVQALGRVGARGAVPQLLALARRGLRQDPDLLMSVLIALTRVTPDNGRETASLLRAIGRAAGTQPDRFEVDLAGTPMPADFPDSSSLRATILQQLATLGLLRYDDDPKWRERVDKMLGTERKNRGSSAFANRALGVAWPPAQMPMVEALRRMGADGLARLERVVGDDSCDPALRVAALALLPAGARDRLAEGLVAAARAAPAELVIAAIEVLDAGAPHKLSAAWAEALRAMRTGLHVAPPERRSQWLALLQALDRYGLLDAADLLPLLARIRENPPPRGHATSLRLREELGALVSRLVAGVAGGLDGEGLDERIAALVDAVIELRVDRRFVDETRDSAIAYVRGQLADVPRNRRNQAYRDMVAAAILDYFVPAPPELQLGQLLERQGDVPLETAILLALGRTRQPAATSALAELLAADLDPVYRAGACLAAGMTGDRLLLRPLARALLDDDGFVRFCAYEALRHLSSEDHWADWMYGDLVERGAAAQEWFRCAIRLGR